MAITLNLRSSMNTRGRKGYKVKGDDAKPGFFHVDEYKCWILGLKHLEESYPSIAEFQKQNIKTKK